MRTISQSKNKPTASAVAMAAKARPWRHNRVDRKRELCFKEEGQFYAQVKTELGDKRLGLICFQATHSGEDKDCLGHIRGAMDKREWAHPKDIVLVSLRDFDSKKVDIIHRYTADEAIKLQELEELPAHAPLSHNKAKGQRKRDNIFDNFIFRQLAVQ